MLIEQTGAFDLHPQSATQIVSEKPLKESISQFYQENLPIAIVEEKTPVELSASEPINHARPRIRVRLATPTADPRSVINLLKGAAEAFNLRRQEMGYPMLWLQNLDLSDRDLNHTNWRQCILINVKFNSSRLNNASFRNAILRNVDFTNASIKLCDFGQVDLNATVGLERGQLNVLNLIEENPWLLRSPQSQHPAEDVPQGLDSVDMKICLKMLNVCMKPHSKMELARVIDLHPNSKMFKCNHQFLMNRKYLLKTLNKGSKRKTQKYQVSELGVNFFELQSNSFNLNT